MLSYEHFCITFVLLKWPPSVFFWLLFYCSLILYLFIYLFVFIYLSVCCCRQGQGTAQIGEGGDNTWIVLDDDDNDDDEEMKDNDEAEITGENTTPETMPQSPQQKNGNKGEKK